MKAIKSRIKSVESTMSITKAMELVASSKLRRAKMQEEAVKPYYKLLAETIEDIIQTTGEKNAFIRETDVSSAACYIVIAGDRGLAGGYNANLFRLVRERIKEDDCILPVGKKSVEHYEKQPYRILTTDFRIAASVAIPEAHEIGDIICKHFLSGQFGHVYLVYTEFKSMLTQEPQLRALLPLDKDMMNPDASNAMAAREKENGFTKTEKITFHTDTLYEPSPEEVLSAIIPQYVSGMIYGAVCEASASEFAARRTAMNAANKNADEMISTLTLKYNRARQTMITQEITEIIAGSNTL